MKPKQILILVIILAAALAVVGYGWWQKQKQANQPFSQECGVCGPKGIHNTEGATCASGLECKNSGNGVVSSVSFCVKPGESIDKCL